jgi:thiol:disulfide interchange protein DsbD
MEYAKKVNKPVLLDFTGWACVNCRKMEERVWGEPEVISLLKNEFVLISLYVDERKRLDKEDQYVSPKTGKKIRTVGNKWSDLQITKYEVNAQPYYAILNTVGDDIVTPVGYTPDVNEYAKWLQSGIDNNK